MSELTKYNAWLPDYCYISCMPRKTVLTHDVAGELLNGRLLISNRCSHQITY